MLHVINLDIVLFMLSLIFVIFLSGSESVQLVSFKFVYIYIVIGVSDCHVREVWDLIKLVYFLSNFVLKLGPELPSST